MDDVTAHVRGGCAQERADVEERCGSARVARQAYDAALEQGRAIRRRLTASRHALEEAAVAADARRRAELKERAQAAFKGERATADSDAARAEAAARWARAVDTINRETRIAVRAHAQAKGVVASLEGELRAAEANEQSLRVSAESAEAACLDARVRLATCEERALTPQLVPAATTSMAPVTPAVAMAHGSSAAAAPVAVPPGSTTAPLPGQAPSVAGTPPMAQGGSVAVATPTAGPPRGTPPGSGPRMPGPPPGSGVHPRIGQGAPTVIEALLSGDRAWLERIASSVAETIGRGAPEVFAHFRELIDAFVATAASHGYVMVDTAHEFWSRLTADESRDVLAALARLGFQVEPSEGWHADRVPVQSDLSMALAYAGLDARSLRHLPSNAQLRELPRSIAVDTRSLLINEAPDLALDHVVRMLGHRADTLGPLWDDWGSIRPLLLSDPRTLP